MVADDATTRTGSGSSSTRTRLGEPAGVVRALADPAGGTWSAWTELFPSFGDSELLLTQNLSGQHTTVLSEHAFLVALAGGPAGPEVAGDDYVDLEGVRTVYAGLVLDAQGDTVELDGNLEGYAIDPAGARNYLLVDAGGVEWFRSPTAPAATVALSAAVSGASFVLSGSVTGGSARCRRRDLARDGGGLGARHHPPTRGRRQLRPHRHAAGAAPHVSRRVPRRGRAADRSARA